MSFTKFIYIYIHTKFHIPSSKLLLVTVIKPTAKFNFHAVVMLLFYSIKKITSTKVICFSTSYSAILL